MSFEHKIKAQVYREVPDLPLSQQHRVFASQRDSALRAKTIIAENQPQITSSIENPWIPTEKHIGREINPEAYRVEETVRRREAYERSQVFISIRLDNAEYAIYSNESVKQMLNQDRLDQATIDKYYFSRRGSLKFFREFTQEQLQAYERIRITEAVEKPPEQEVAPGDLIEQAGEMREAEEVVPKLVIDENIQELLVEGKIVKLSNAEYNILFHLADYHGAPISNRALRKEAYELAALVDLKTVNNAVSSLKRKLTRATKKNDLIQSEIRPKSALYTLTNCEVEFIEVPEEEPEKPPVEPTQIRFEDGFFNIAGRSIALNDTEAKILRYLATHPGERVTRDNLNRDLFGAAPMDARHLREAINSMRGTLKFVTGSDLLNIGRGTQGDITLENCIFIEPESISDAAVLRQLETPTLPEDETQDTSFSNAILSSLVRTYNDKTFTLGNGDQVTLSLGDDNLKRSQILGIQALAADPSILLRTYEQFVDTRAKLLTQLRALLGSDNFEEVIKDFPHETKQLLEDIYLHEAAAEIVSQLAANSDQITLEDEFSSLAKPWVGVPEAKVETLDPEDVPTNKRIRSLLAQFEAAEKDDISRTYPIGELILNEAARIRDFTVWSDADIIRFIIQKLPKSEAANDSTIKLFWNMVKFAQNRPEDPVSKLAGRTNLRSIAPHDVPGIDIPMPESGRTRLVYRVYNAKGQKLIRLEGAFRDHTAYDSFINRNQ
jgi:DNA-binding response OmpR family regulator